MRVAGANCVFKLLDPTNNLLARFHFTRVHCYLLLSLFLASKLLFSHSLSNTVRCLKLALVNYAQLARTGTSELI